MMRWLILLLIPVLGVAYMFVLSFIRARKDKEIARAMASNSWYKDRLDELNRIGINHGDIIMVGDSITHSGEWDKYFSVPVKNFGIGGDVIEALSDRINYVLDHNPKKIFIMIGINNIVGRGSAVNETIKKYRALIIKIKSKSPNTKIVVQSLLPINYATPLAVSNNYWMHEGKILSYNASLKKLCEKMGVVFIHLYDHFLESGTNYLRSDLTTDGLHLNDAGYAVWCGLIRFHIEH